MTDLTDTEFDAEMNTLFCLDAAVFTCLGPIKHPVLSAAQIGAWLQEIEPPDAVELRGIGIDMWLRRNARG